VSGEAAQLRTLPRRGEKERLGKPQKARMPGGHYKVRAVLNGV